MQSLVTAIYNQVLTSLAGTFPAWTPANGTSYPVSYFADLAPTGAPFPRLIGSIVPRADSQSKYSGGMAYEPVGFRFTAYSNVSLADVLTKTEALMGVFDDLILTLSSGTMINTVRTGQPTAMLEQAAAGGGQNVYRASVQYVLTISH